MMETQEVPCRLHDVETIERLVAHFVVALLSEGYEPIDISATLAAAASVVMDGEGEPR